VRALGLLARALQFSIGVSAYPFILWYLIFGSVLDLQAVPPARSKLRCSLRYL